MERGAERRKGWFAFFPDPVMFFLPYVCTNGSLSESSQPRIRQLWRRESRRSGRSDTEVMSSRLRARVHGIRREERRKGSSFADSRWWFDSVNNWKDEIRKRGAEDDGHEMMMMRGSQEGERNGLIYSQLTTSCTDSSRPEEGPRIWFSARHEIYLRLSLISGMKVRVEMVTFKSAEWESTTSAAPMADPAPTVPPPFELSIRGSSKIWWDPLNQVIFAFGLHPVTEHLNSTLFPAMIDEDRGGISFTLNGFTVCQDPNECIIQNKWYTNITIKMTTMDKTRFIPSRTIIAIMMKISAEDQEPRVNRKEGEDFLWLIALLLDHQYDNYFLGKRLISRKEH